MDLRADNLSASDVIPGGAVVDNIGSSVKNVFAGIRNKAKAKKAQGVADSGQYWTLRPFLKGLIKIPQYILDQVAGQGITETAVLTLPAQAVGTSNDSIIKSLIQLSGGGASASVGTGGVIGGGSASEVAAVGEDTTAGKLKKFLPYILGAVVIGVAIYFFVKRK